MSVMPHAAPIFSPTLADASLRPARIILATIERPQGDTGVHAHANALTDGLRRAGIECELANPFAAGAKWLPLFAMRKLILKPINKTWSLRWYRHWHYAALCESLMRSVLQRDTDAVIAQCPVSARAALEVRRRLGINFKIAMVCHFNYSEATEYRDKGELNDPKLFDRMMKLESLILRSVDEVIYVSNWARNTVETDRGIIPRGSHVIWNGIATNISAPAVNRHDIGIGDNELLLINVGSLEPRKNQIGLLDLFARIRKTHPSARLLLVGDGPQRGAIEEKIRINHLNDAVTLLGHRTDVPALLKSADLYVHYSKLENCPVILLEAARAALPIAALPVGGIGEVGDKLGGIVHLAENELDQSLAALRPLLDSADARRSAGGRARAGFEQHFTRDAMVRQYLDALELQGEAAR